MLSFVPKIVSNKGIQIYFISLALVSVAFFSHIMELKFMLIGAAFVLLFFTQTQQLSQKWRRKSPKAFASNLLKWALVIRIVWVIFSYFFYMAETGQPFEWGAADAAGYHDEAKWLASSNWSVAWNYYSAKNGVSDIGYPLYLTLLYKIAGPSIIIARLLKAVWGSLTCVLIYKLSARTFGERTGRIAGLFGMLMPNLIIYCGLHVKETEMLFCTMMFLERSDYLLRTRHFSFKNIAVLIFFGLYLFFFRTVLGAVAFASLFTAIIFTSKRVATIGRKWTVAIMVGLALMVFAGGTILTEVEGYWNARTENQSAKRQQQENRGSNWAKYATGAVMAPMIFVIPFPTMIDTDQQNQNVMHSGNFIKNFIGIFVLMALFYSIKSKKWRDFSLIGSFAVFYLGIIAFSAFANAERFHFPALPCILMMAAYGLSQLNGRNRKFVNYWSYIVVAMAVAWAFFKLGSRGAL